MLTFGEKLKKDFRKMEMVQVQMEIFQRTTDQLLSEKGTFVILEVQRTTWWEQRTRLEGTVHDGLG